MAIACRDALTLAVDLLLLEYRVVCDSSNIIGSIGGEGLCFYGHIIKEIKARMRDFSMCEFVHEGTTSNIDAHNLAHSTRANLEILSTGGHLH